MDLRFYRVLGIMAAVGSRAWVVIEFDVLSTIHRNPFLKKHWFVDHLHQQAHEQLMVLNGQSLGTLISKLCG